MFSENARKRNLLAFLFSDRGDALPVSEPIQRKGFFSFLFDFSYTKEYLKYPISSFGGYKMIQSISQSLYSGTSMLALCKGMFFSLLQNVLEIRSFISLRTIDTNHDPFIPEGLEIESHIATGKIRWNKNEFGSRIHVFDEYQTTNFLSGVDLLQEVKLTSVANARVLDWLLSNMHQIPVNVWRGKKILFLGTIYKNRYGKVFVRCLDCTNKKICWDIICLNKTVEENSFILFML